MLPQQLARFGGTSRTRAGEPSPQSAVPTSLVRDTQINGGIVNVAGRDNITYNQVHCHTQNKADLKAILQAIPNFRQIHQDTLDRATPGTGVWLLESELLRVWLDPNGDLKIMWGYGIPGAGKTILAALVIAMLESLAEKQGRRLCVAYIYIRYSDRTEMTVRNILEVFVKQTVERHPDCIPIVEKAYARHVAEGTKPTESQLLTILQELTSWIPTVYVLDALDEAPTDIQLDLIEKLATLNCKIFMTSRPLKAVEAHFPDAHTFPIVAQDKDLDLLIDQKLNKSADLRGLFRTTGASIRDEIMGSIKRNCGGMFLHASLQLDSISQCLSINDIRRTLEAFPAQIEEVYLHTWRRILDQGPRVASLAKAVLLWVLNAQRSMTIEDLECAVAVSLDGYKFDPSRLVPGASLIGHCRGLVTVDEKSRLVRLVHYTVKDTLERLLNDYYPHPHSLLAIICLTHLTDCGFQNPGINSRWELVRVLKGDSLLAYAHNAWAFHAQQSLDVKPTANFVANFVAHCHAFPMLLDGAWDFDLFGPLHIVAWYNFPFALTGSHVGGNPNVLTKEQGYSPLFLACWQGHQNAVDALLCLATLAVNAVTNTGEVALTEAASKGREGIVKLLLSHPKINVNIVDHSGWSAYMKAASMGHKGIVKLLLAHPKINVNIVDDIGRSALAEAVSHGHTGIVKLLLARPEIDVNKGWALTEAAAHGYWDIVKLLIAHPEINVNKGAALAEAAAHVNERLVKLLLAHPKIDVNKGGALAEAASRVNIRLVKLLVAHPKINVNIFNGFDRPVLAAAASEGHEGIVKLLLAHPNIDVNIIDDFGWSVLMEAARNGHKGIVKLLLAHPKINVNAANCDGWTALQMAFENGHTEVASCLLAVSGINTTQSSGSKIVATEEEVYEGSDDAEETIKSTQAKRKATTMYPAGAPPAKRVKSSASKGKAKATLTDEEDVVVLPKPRRKSKKVK